MASVCIYFQVHQPHRLRRYSVFDSDGSYFDTQRNSVILDKVVRKCYLPASQLLLELVRKHKGNFRFAFSFTGLILDQLRREHPQTLALIQELVKTGCVEMLGETFHHSLGSIYSPEDFIEQIDLHAALVEELFDVKPRVFRNTELIYSNKLADLLAEMGRYKGVLTEGADHVLAGRSPNVLYHPPGHPGLKLLLKNYRLSDDIAFRFSDRQWDQWPLTAEKYARWLGRNEPAGEVRNLFMDFETFGEHQWADSGIFDFLSALPGAILADQRHDFRTPSECIASFAAAGEYDVPHLISWADTERDVSAWLGNAMQSNALREIYRLEAPIKNAGDPALLEDWRRLTTSDHFYYMCTKYFADGQVHAYFNPYESPYDSFINFMNVLDSLRTRVARQFSPSL